MDVDAYIAAHSATWRRLEELVGGAGSMRRLSGHEVDELVDLYQRTATHLSVVRTASPDPQLVARLSTLVARARGVVAGGRTRSWRDAGRFVAVTFPVVVYRRRWWVVGIAAAFAILAFGIGAWVAGDPLVQRSVAAPAEVRRLADHEFADYYSSAPAGAFAADVFVNNARVGATAFALGIFLALPTVYVLGANAVNVGVVGGLMASAGKSSVFFGLILPHGLLELTAVFVAGALGMRLGWRVIDPGPRPRSEALAEEGRSAMAGVAGLVAVFFVAGLIEAFVTPSGLPTWARLAIGISVELAFIAYIVVLGRRAEIAGETGDLAVGERADVLPVA